MMSFYLFRLYLGTIHLFCLIGNFHMTLAFYSFNLFLIIFASLKSNYYA